MASVISPAEVLAEVERVMAAPWCWGSADCCTSACDVFLALQGLDPMAALRGKYDGAISAARLIRQRGGFVAVAEAMAHTTGLQVSNAQPGDIGLSMSGMAEGPERRALLICVQPGQWAGKTVQGFAILPMAERGWSCVNCC